ncbi:MAG: shikimate dehydrogenase [Actinomycetota bacterium]
MTAALEWPEPDVDENLLGVIGWPVEHSLSPVIHTAAFEDLGMRGWRYVHLPVQPGGMAAAAERLVSKGYRGANVTMPHKESAFELSLPVDDDVTRLRAVNTLVVDAATSQITGHNTDVQGFEEFLGYEAGFDPRGKTALIFGAGGAARACALSLARSGAGTIVVAARDPSKADALRETVSNFPAELRVVAWGEAGDEEANLVLNATPVGSDGSRVPLPRLGSETVAVDLVYSRAVTPMLESARAAGAPAFGGLGLLVRQAALSFELWTGRAPSLEAMRAAAEDAAGAA